MFFLIPSARAIQNGKSPAGYNGTVFMVSGEAGIGTATNTFVPRCMLTADHVMEELGSSASFYQGENPTMDPGPTVPSQGIERFTTRNRGQTVWTDLAVVWLRNNISFFGTPARIPISSYRPLPVAKSPLLQSVADTTPVTPSPDGPIAATGIGYGDAWGLLLELGAGTKRIGTMQVVSYSQGNLLPAPLLPELGSFYTIGMTNTTSNQICAGDSGGPLLYSSTSGGLTIYGVASTRNVWSCQTVSQGAYTGIDRGTISGQISNYDWVNRAAERLCNKEVDIEIPSGLGVITGSVSTTRTWTPTPSLDSLDPENAIAPNLLNRQFLCGQDGNGNVYKQCSQLIYDQGTSSSQADIVQLHAQPAAGYSFGGWNNYEGDGFCPCMNNPTNPDCSFNYSQVGYFDELNSQDFAHCGVTFTRSYGGSTTGSGYTATYK